ncbi:MAG TPA: hypothetical protein VMT26_05105, partial [Candidatus Bathyarchaeia archaeon]|nr:hypothetical protein [Candidatus Bathyarchaeia archaeon]
MAVLDKALQMLDKHPLCDHCLGRQFAMLGYGMENSERGRSIKTVLTFNAQTLAFSKNKEGVRVLKILATNGFSETAKQILRKTKKRIQNQNLPKKCFLCEDKFENITDFVEKALKLLESYEYSSFLVGIELPLAVAEREDE